MIAAYVGSGDIERALVELKRQVARDGVLRELKARRFFLSRSERRRVKDRDALRRCRKLEKKRQEYEARSTR